MNNNRIYSISEIKQVIFPIAKRYGISSIYIFGSYARGDATAKSDVDIYIPSLPATMGLSYFGMYEDLKESLDKNIDIVTDDTEFLNAADKQNFLNNINRDKVYVYE